MNNMSIFERIRNGIPDGTELHTPALKKPFTVFTDNCKVTFHVGKNKTPIPVSEPYWESAVNFLRGRGWVEIGTRHQMDVKKNTFEEFLDGCGRKGHSSWASYVAPVLEKIGAARIDRETPPSKIKLIE